MRTLFVLPVAMAMLVACETDTAKDVPNGTAGSDAEMSAEMSDPAETEPMTITGTLAYRQRIALPADAIASILVYEEGPADMVREEIASESFELNGRQVPIPFQVIVPADIELERDRLSLRAEIHDAAGDLMWTSDTANIFDRTEGLYELGNINLVPTTSAVVSMDQLTAHEWMAATLNGDPLFQSSQITMTFEEDGRVSGSSSCNSYTGSFKLNAGTLTFGPLAMTRRACFPQEIMEQEQAFVAVMGDNPDVDLDENGLLTLTGADGRSLTAR
ncbi:META domain-containing protein [Henriciella sp. AS95]|uniref:META domain-containing protein n=1 Tax=Henriciella sp. AS95 TaxID=3135782 RepID=UPI00317D3C12